MIILVFVGFFMVTLVALHMAQPRFKPKPISAARFFKDLPKALSSKRRLSLGNPLRSLPLYIQFPLLILALIALLSAPQMYTVPKDKSIGLWVVLDTSASMSTQQAGGDRMTAARKVIQQLIEHARSLSSDTSVCAQLSTFDLELRNIQPATRDLEQILRTIGSLEARPLGTDLTLIQSLLNQAPDLPATSSPVSPQSGLACKITHVVVVSDQPAPQWANVVQPMHVIWLDVGLPVSNAGITSLTSTRDPLTGQISQISVGLDAYGDAAPSPQVQVLDPGGQVVLNEQVKWSEGGHWQTVFKPHAAGMYKIQLLPIDAYAYDNQATLEVTTGQELRVDWQLPDRTLLDQLHWQVDASHPDFRVVPADTPTNDSIPTLLVGNGYRGEGQIEEILYFVQGNPLLSDLNLDVAERIGIQGEPLPKGFDIILMGTQNKVWIAERLNPPAVYVPGLPQGQDPLWSFSVTVFFNGVRRLLQATPLPPLYTLTSPNLPEPSGNRLALHPDEGNTARPAFSIGSIEDLQPVSQVVESNPAWPIWLLATITVFLVERILFSFGGSRWR